MTSHAIGLQPCMVGSSGETLGINGGFDQRDGALAGNTGGADH